MLASAYLQAFDAASAAGDGPECLERAWASGHAPGMRLGDSWAGRPVPSGHLPFDLPGAGALPPDHDSRNNRLAWHVVSRLAPMLQVLASQYGADRVGVCVGTSTSGVAEAEAAFKHKAVQGVLAPAFRYGQQEISSPALFLRQALGLKGPAAVISTACSSSAKALASARRWLRLGICDAVLVGGVDTLCSFTVRGFDALGALSSEACLPFSANRRGINIGEAAAFFVLSKQEGPVRLAGCGESNDGYHVSSPLPQGEGAEQAMRLALQDAGCLPGQVDYLNLHGTATPQNDHMEAQAVSRVFANGVACSSTKPLTGHTLGAAGALEAGIAWMLLQGAAQRAGLPPNFDDGVRDAALPVLGLLQGPQGPSTPKRILSNSFGFGGSNAAVLLVKE